jgi:hypothetical protein
MAGCAEELSGYRGRRTAAKPQVAGLVGVHAPVSRLQAVSLPSQFGFWLAVPVIWALVFRRLWDALRQIPSFADRAEEIENCAFLGPFPGASPEGHRERRCPVRSQGSKSSRAPACPRPAHGGRDGSSTAARTITAIALSAIRDDLVV